VTDYSLTPTGSEQVHSGCLYPPPPLTCRHSQVSTRRHAKRCAHRRRARRARISTVNHSRTMRGVRRVYCTNSEVCRRVDRSSSPKRARTIMRTNASEVSWLCAAHAHTHMCSSKHVPQHSGIHALPANDSGRLCRVRHGTCAVGDDVFGSMCQVRLFDNMLK
jgi:hypothetical protein